MKIKFKSIAPIIFFATILIINFYFLNNQYFQVHDWTGGARIYDLHQALKDGHFPPRWSKNHGFGYGMPLFQFYSPLPFFISEIFVVFGFSILTSLKLSYLTISIIGFLGSYNLAKKLTNKWGGLISASAFSLCTYHALNIYVRGALAELLAINLMPWTIYYVIQLIRDKYRQYYLGLTLSLTALFLSHNVTIITFMPFWAITAFYFLFLKNQNDKKQIKKSLSLIILSGFNAFLLASFFLLPAFLQKKYTRVDSLTGGFSQYPQHFIYFRQLFIPNWDYGGSIGGPDDDMSFYLGNEILLIVLITGIALILQFIKGKTNTKKSNLSNFVFLSICFLISIFLTNFKSQFIWDKLPLVSFIQFPWRYLGVASFFLAILAGYSSKIIKKPELASVAIFILIAFFSGRYFYPKKLENLKEIYDPNPEFIQTRMSEILPDYLPPDIDWQNWTPPNSIIEIKNGEGEFNVITHKTQQILADINLKTDAIIKVNRFVFPNWVVEVDKEKVDCKIKDFAYECLLDSGRHELDFYWSEKGLNQISNYLSLVGIILLIWISRSRFIKDLTP
jgi:hypothetical protein